MKTLIDLICQLRKYYPRLSLIDLLIAACEELLHQNEGRYF